MDGNWVSCGQMYIYAEQSDEYTLTPPSVNSLINTQSFIQ